MHIDGTAARVTGGASGRGLATVENGYLNVETVRLDGAIRMAPR